MLIGAFSQYFFGFTIFILSTFLILLVLVQRGRGGGLTGALGGPGGQSAFGTKAGDLFTRITVGVAAVWIVLCATAVFVMKEAALPETRVGALPSMTSDSTDKPSSASSNSLPGFDGLKLPTGTGTGSTPPVTGSGSTSSGAATTPAATTTTPAATTTPATTPAASTTPETKPTTDAPAATTTPAATPAAETPSTTNPPLTEPAKPAEPKVDAPATSAPAEGTSPAPGTDK